MIFSNWILTGSLFSFSYTSNIKKSLPVYLPFKYSVEYTALSYLNIKIQSGQHGIKRRCLNQSVDVIISL